MITIYHIIPIVLVSLFFILIVYMIIENGRVKKSSSKKEDKISLSLNYPKYFKFITNSTPNVYKTIGINIVPDRVNNEYIPLKCSLRGETNDGIAITVDMDKLTKATEEEYNDNKKIELKELGL